MGRLSQEVNLIVIVSFFLFLVAGGIITLVLVYRRKQVEYINEQARLKTAFEKELLEAQLEIQEQTMKQIGIEIHDNIGATLSLVKLNLKTISLEEQRGAKEKIANSDELLTKAIANLRTLSKTLHTEAVLSAGLERSIEMELGLIGKAAVFETRFTITGTPFFLDEKKELILFRTVQEALNNAIKHSQASFIEVSLHYHPNELQLSVTDNGKGFNHEAEEKNPEKGSGLRNMQNRTKLIGGQLSIDGTNGTKIQITLPIIAA